MLNECESMNTNHENRVYHETGRGSVILSQKAPDSYELEVFLLSGVKLPVLTGCHGKLLFKGAHKMLRVGIAG